MYGKKSLERLAAAHPILQTVFDFVGHRFSNTIAETSRTVEQQIENVAKGVSKTMKSKHLKTPAEAVDAYPDPVEIPQREPKGITPEIRAHYKILMKYYYFGGYVLGASDALFATNDIRRPLRWGGDWDNDRDIRDQTFNDLPHFELADG